MASPNRKIWLATASLIAAAWLLAFALARNIRSSRAYVMEHGALAWCVLVAALILLWLPALAALRGGRYPKSHFIARTVADALLASLLAGLLVFDWPPALLIFLALAMAGGFGARAYTAWAAWRSGRG